MKIFKSVLLLMIFSGICIMAKTEVKVPEIKTETVYINGNKNYEIIKPVFTNNVKFKAVNDEINKLIDVEALKEDEKEICVNDPERCGDYVVSVGPDLIYADNNVISFTINGYQYTGGAHGGSWVTAFLVNRKTGKIITDTLKTNNKAIFNKIQKYITDNPQGIFFEDEYTAEDLMNSAVVYQTGKDTIGIMYMSYAVAPYAAGMPEFEYNTKTKKLYFLDGYSGEKVQKVEIK